MSADGSRKEVNHSNVDGCFSYLVPGEVRCGFPKCVLAWLRVGLSEKRWRIGHANLERGGCVLREVRLLGDKTRVR